MSISGTSATLKIMWNSIHQVRKSFLMISSCVFYILFTHPTFTLSFFSCPLSPHDETNVTCLFSSLHCCSHSKLCSSTHTKPFLINSQQPLCPPDDSLDMLAVKNDNIHNWLHCSNLLLTNHKQASITIQSFSQEVSRLKAGISEIKSMNPRQMKSLCKVKIICLGNCQSNCKIVCKMPSPSTCDTALRRKERSQSLSLTVIHPDTARLSLTLKHTYQNTIYIIN